MNAPIDPRSLPLRYSRLKTFAQSPLHYWHSAQEEKGQTLAMRLGSGSHALLFDQPVAVFEGRRVGAAWSEFQNEHDGKTILNINEHEQAKRISDAVRANKLASELLFQPGMTYEKKLSWEVNGRACRGTPDAFGNGVVIDLKSTKCAEPSKFVRDSHFRAYHGQTSWYDNGIRRAGLPECHGQFLIAVESTEPHPVVVLELTARAKSIGEMLWSSWFEQLMVCEASNSYPGYTESIVAFDAEEPVELTFGGVPFEVD